MEDLGVRSCSTLFKPEPLQQADFPESLKQYVKVCSAFHNCSSAHLRRTTQSMTF